MDAKVAPVETTHQPIRLSTATCDRLRVFGVFGESWNDLLLRLVGELEDCQASHQHCRQRAAESARPAPAGKE